MPNRETIEDNLLETLKEESAEVQAIQIIEEDTFYISEEDNPFYSDLEELDIIKLKLGKDKEDELAVRKWLFSQIRGKHKKHKAQAEKILKEVYNLRMVPKEEYIKDKQEEKEKKDNANPGIQMQEMRKYI